MRHGQQPDTPVALIRWGTRAEQRTLIGTCGDIAGRVREAEFLPPAVIVVGDVVRLREKMQLVRRNRCFRQAHPGDEARSQSQRTGRSGSRNWAAKPCTFPCCNWPRFVMKRGLRHWMRPCDRWRLRLARLHQRKRCGIFLQTRARETGMDIRQIRGRIAAVGPKTAEALLGGWACR